MGVSTNLFLLARTYRAEDTLEAELMRELENGRLVRLLTKFGFINERPEFVFFSYFFLPSSLADFYYL